MMNAWQAARRSRDARFDGRFFIAVTTTGIYCRPVCPAPSPKEENVRYYPSAAAAAEAGFRPCLRCRPETSPVWNGTSGTVARALRLIDESALDEAGVDELAARLGIGSRHLRRLFLEHLGATPVAVAQTRRIHFAKKLIDETALPFTEVALASGFGSVRRFNATFQKLYQRTPSDLRRLAGKTAVNDPGDYRFRLRFRPPYDWERVLGFLRPRAIPGVEIVDEARYRRTISMDGMSGSLEANRNGDAIELRIQFPGSKALFRIVERVKRLFDLNADPAEISACLGQDPILAARVAARPGLRVPGAWDGFELAVRAVLGQQVTVKGATTLSGRVAAAYGVPVGDGYLFPTREAIAEADFKGLGLTSARAETLRQIAQAGNFTLDEFRGLRGIGEWTAQYYAMRALHEPDAFPSGDLALLKASGLSKPKELEQRAEAWRPWRAYAAMHLWQGEA